MNNLDVSCLQPLYDRILVRRIVTENTHKGLIIIPDVAMKKSHRGEIIATGPGKRFKNGTYRPMEVKPGDVVEFSMDDYDDGDYVLITEGDILGIHCS